MIPEGSDPARLGRRIFGALYVALTIYVIGSGLASVVPQIFWPARALGEAPAPEERCAAALSALQTELAEHGAEAARSLDGRSGEAGIDARPWLDTWDGRYRALEAPCGHLRSYRLLGRTRYAVEERVLRTITETAEGAAETRRALDDDLEHR